MTMIQIEIDNEYFMVKVQRNLGFVTHRAFIMVLTPNQQNILYEETVEFKKESHCQQFELDFDKRDAKKLVKRYLKFR